MSDEKPAVAPAVPPIPFMPREEYDALPMGKYPGKTEIVEDDRLAEVMSLLAQETVLGFDTETKPCFRKGEFHLPALIQVAGESGVFLFPLRRISDPTPIFPLLEDSQVLKVGVGVGDDMIQLQKIRPFQASGVLDLSHLASKRGLTKTGVRWLAAHFLGMRISKKAKCSNWERDPLQAFQIDYAATDAWVCREVYLKMAAEGWL